MNIKSITHAELNVIHNFLQQSIYDFRSIQCGSHELIISLPNYLKHILRSYPMEIPVYSQPETLFEKSMYCNVRVQPHYTDEIVVFFEDFHINCKLFAPKIHVINFETVEK